MSILAGVMSRNGSPIPPEVEAALRSSLSRNPGHRAVEHRAAGVYLCKVDLGAYGSPGLHVSSSGSVTMVAGHPLLTEVAGARGAHVDALHASAGRNEWAVLERARGTYCAVHYSAADRALSLIVDKVGVRPLYYYASRDVVYFASAMRILVDLAAVPKVVDLRGTAELLAYGHGLGRRTPYADIRVLHSGEVVRIDAKSVSLRTYWDWAARVASHETRTPPRRLYELFSRAVKDRLEGDRTTLAFLSGGLDSRCIVSELRAQGARVHSFNFYRTPDTQEAVLSTGIATALGTEHHSLPLPQHRLDAHEPMFTAMGEIGAGDSTIERPKLAWSGDGGSVGPGLVYVDKDIVRFMRAGREREAIETFIARFGSRLSPRVFTRDVARVIVDLPVDGGLAEMAALPAADAARKFHLFLIVNNQRCHLTEHFENLDLRGIELHLPFFDADFLHAVFSVPMDESVEHIVYNRMLQEFTPATRSVPWQTYPGHEPCPLPIPPNLLGQWDRRVRATTERATKRARLKSMRRTLTSRDFPHPILNRPNLFAYLVAYTLGVSDYGWVAAIASGVQQLWSRSARRYVISGLDQKTG